MFSVLLFRALFGAVLLLEFWLRWCLHFLRKGTISQNCGGGREKKRSGGPNKAMARLWSGCRNDWSQELHAVPASVLALFSLVFTL
mmetsp:Transcript_26357/g.61308  ORF Transcript_26357/g.61308 Transcript_26357/m.61308 type:complete len:86 (+) Transcript_26357:2193-2450(+)